MFIDHPYVKDAHIVYNVDHRGGTRPVLVVETTVPLPAEPGKKVDFQTLDLMEMLAELQTFADYDFADFQQVLVIGPDKGDYPHPPGHAVTH